MPETVVLHARIRPDLKEGAEKIFRELGISTTEAISMFFATVKRTRSLPLDLDLKVPNAETRRAMRDMEKGKYKTFNSVEELMEDLRK